MIKELPEIMKKTGWPWTEEVNPNIYDRKINCPKITIVTPSYNQGKFIEETIRSILLQNYPNIEYIIIDGGSTDNTIDIIKKYEKYITFWVSESDKGQANAINKGLQYATGDIFNWLNSDDYLEKGALYDVASIFLHRRNIHVVCGYTHCFYQSTGKTSHTYRMGLKQNPTQTILNIEMNQPGTFYKLSIIKELDGVNESLHYAFDDELWIRFISKYGIKNVYLSNKLYAHFRLHEDSKSVAKEWQHFIDERNSVYLYIAQIFKFPSFIIESIEKQIKKYYYNPFNFKDLSYLDSEEILAYFCNKFMFNYYKNYLYKELEFAFRIQKKYYPMNWRTFVLFFKVFIIPRKILKFLRR